MRLTAWFPGLNNSEPWGPQAGQAIKAREGVEDGRSRPVRNMAGKRAMVFPPNFRGTALRASRFLQASVRFVGVGSQQPL